MALTITVDTVAEDVVERDAGLGATRFDGWLGPPAVEPAEGEPRVFRLFTAPSFLEWLEISERDILAQVSGNGFSEGRSAVWVNREARIKRCQAGCAYWFAEMQEKVRDDPTARWPPPH
jgi:hypothetical protein